MTDKIIKLPEVTEKTALSRSSIYAFMSKGEFPLSIPLGLRAVGWKESEIISWLHEQEKKRPLTPCYKSETVS